MSLNPRLQVTNRDGSIVIHERGDDMRTGPSGDSGNRIACGVIPSKR
ncbi:superoxide dismutase family protein [Terriglobus aquaticus]|uniref:Superoxide dismutase [Cu-Zn] n=1 Tax=Terriglobus aquaticus TaxID=940139 RepID=A0ABW9KJE0_9BACT|nr:superoxide dismutase family protein [Terriglobus aquaticus]